ncbi:hypothetical protein JR316_0007890 [Psilocybe cubensis]|uniref:Uncharacterized protein n=2 Tax=Psilocybe cubensis TaxID=181762 RepID=A0A8H7XRS6_PSICU|nr:hypothetical protein JR316_0007890 [Psilocybe cubensis]KAH9479301.1 hypothetical protein JR316_0007890 [Psilocybe cubensis]
MAAPASIGVIINTANVSKAADSGTEVSGATIFLQARSQVLKTQELLDTILQHIRPGFGGHADIATLYATNVGEEAFSQHLLWGSLSQPNPDDLHVSTCLKRCVQNTGSKLSSIDILGDIYVSWNAFMPIAKVSQPITIRINIDGLMMTDNDILNFFSNRKWLKLQHLEIMGFATRPDLDTLSPVSLGIIAMHSPSLMSLKLSFTINTETTALQNLKTQLHSDASGLKHLENVSVAVCKPPGEEFDPGPNAVKGAAIISQYMDRCLSNVQLIELKHPNNEGSQWLDGVYEMLTNYRSVRGLK